MPSIQLRLDDITNSARGAIMNCNDILYLHEVHILTPPGLDLRIGIECFHFQEPNLPPPEKYRRAIYNRLFLGINPTYFTELEGRRLLTQDQEIQLVEIAKKLYASAENGYSVYSPEDAIEEALGLDLNIRVKKQIVTQFFQQLGVLEESPHIYEDHRTPAMDSDVYEQIFTGSKDPDIWA